MSKTTSPISHKDCENSPGLPEPVGEATAPPVIELTTELSELTLFCPFCGEQVYDWSAEDSVSPCKHLVGSENDWTSQAPPTHQLGDVIFCICDSGPRPEVQFLVFRNFE